MWCEDLKNCICKPGGKIASVGTYVSNGKLEERLHIYPHKYED